MKKIKNKIYIIFVTIINASTVVIFVTANTAIAATSIVLTLIIYVTDTIDNEIINYAPNNWLKAQDRVGENNNYLLVKPGEKVYTPRTKDVAYQTNIMWVSMFEKKELVLC